jgi:hypothetical protein
MSTRAQIAIQTGARLVAHEICQVRANELDCFDPPRAPQILRRPTCELSHLNGWENGGWVDLTDRNGWLK